MNAKKPLISVLIGSKDRPDALLRCIESVLAQTFDDYEILVLDDNSKTPFGEFIRSKCSDIRLRLYRSETTLGVAGGRNKIIRQAGGEYLLTLDDDAILRDHNALEKIPDFFKQHPDVGLFSFKIIDIIDGKEAGYRVPFMRKIVKRSPEILDRVCYVSCFLGGGHVLRADVSRDCGLYQEDFMFGAEESDLAYRIVNKGYAMMFVPEVVVEHYPGVLNPLTKLSREDYARRMYYYMRNRVWINYKYLPWHAFIVSSILWFGFRIASNFNKGAFGSICRGCLDGFRGLPKISRMTLTNPARKYLKDNYGRLYF